MGRVFCAPQHQVLLFQVIMLLTRCLLIATFSRLGTFSCALLFLDQIKPIEQLVPVN